MNPVAMFNARLNLIHKLLIVSALFLVPIGLLGYLFVTQSLKDIDFAAKEVDGIAYIKALRPIFVSAASEPGAVADLITREGKPLAEAAAKFNAGLGMTETYDQLMQTIATAAAKGDHSAIVEALTGAITKVADGSNLTLDPDLDSYYVMDVTAFKTAPVMNVAGRLNRAIASLVGREAS